MNRAISPDKVRAHKPELSIARLAVWRMALWKYALLALDVLLFLGIYVFLRPRLGPGAEIFGMLALFCVAFLYAKGQYSQRQPQWDELGKFGSVIIAAATIHVVALFSLSGTETARLALLAWAFAAVARVIGRTLLKAALRVLRLWNVPTVIIGTGRTAQEAALGLAAEQMLGFDIQAFVAIGPDHPKSISYGTAPLPVVELEPGLVAALRASDGPHVVIALDEHETARARSLVDLLVLRNNAVDMVAPVQGLQLYGLEVNHLLARELLLVRIRNNLASRGSKIAKTAIDYAGALILVAILTPLMIAIALMLLWSGRPVLYAHERIGRHGKTFRCLKFRTMVPDASAKLSELLERDPDLRAHWQRTRKLESDPRITRLGLTLRRTSLDELPQLFNVLRGEMSLVGPRPIMSDELVRYGSEADYYLQVKPGITGLWQVSGRNNLDYSHRVFLDVWYVKNWSVLYDCAILLRTPGAVIRNIGAY